MACTTSSSYCSGKYSTLSIKLFFNSFGQMFPGKDIIAPYVDVHYKELARFFKVNGSEVVETKAKVTKALLDKVKAQRAAMAKSLIQCAGNLAWPLLLPDYLLHGCAVSPYHIPDFSEQHIPALQDLKEEHGPLDLKDEEIRAAYKDAALKLLSPRECCT